MLQQPSRKGWPTTRLAFEFLILTATRSNEVREAAWSEFDLDNAVWVIPKERMKSRKAHSVPLSDRCLENLAASKGTEPRQSAGLRGYEARPAAVGYDVHKASARCRAWRKGDGAWISDPPSRIGALKPAKVRDEVSEAALAHTIKDRVKAAYLRTDFFEDRKSLMEAWSTYCQLNGRLKLPPRTEPPRLTAALVSLKSRRSTERT